MLNWFLVNYNYVLGLRFDVLSVLIFFFILIAWLSRKLYRVYYDYVKAVSESKKTLAGISDCRIDFENGVKEFNLLQAQIKDLESKICGAGNLDANLDIEHITAFHAEFVVADKDFRCKINEAYKTIDDKQFLQKIHDIDSVEHRRWNATFSDLSLKIANSFRNWYTENGVDVVNKITNVTNLSVEAIKAASNTLHVSDALVLCITLCGLSGVDINQISGVDFESLMEVVNNLKNENYTEESMIFVDTIKSKIMYSNMGSDVKNQMVGGLEDIIFKINASND